ncbi:MAG TPA: ferritin-like domain-containing protein [Terriglobales bacterium]|jgi:ferritin-like metal-binding protein YciE
MRAESLRDLYIQQLQDLYNSENQLIKALPKLAKAASSEQLRSTLEEHLEQTQHQASRLEDIFSDLNEDPKGKKCKGMEGLIKEGQEVLEEDMEPEVLDAALIAAAQRVEHYEIAGYGCVKTYAKLLGEQQAAGVLEEILNEEKEADRKLNEIAEEINLEAAPAATANVKPTRRSATRGRSAA